MRNQKSELQIFRKDSFRNVTILIVEYQYQCQYQCYLLFRAGSQTVVDKLTRSSSDCDVKFCIMGENTFCFLSLNKYTDLTLQSSQSFDQ